MKLKKIAIIGLGLMGASLARACRRKLPQVRIVGITRRRSALEMARRKRWIHEGTRDLRLGVRSADLVILCTPINTFPGYLERLDQWARPGTRVTDVGSVKDRILDWVQRRSWKNIQFVGAHPMVGSHERGIQASQPDLYDEGIIFLVRGEKTDAGSYRDVKNFWKKISKHIIELKYGKHDRIVSEISHLPHALAASLMHAVEKKSYAFAAAGFRDTTRVAASDASVWVPIFWTNRREILRSLSIYENKLKELRNSLCAANDQKIRRFLESAAQKRRQI
ncbi:MAG: prephenate dehydrogenase [Candidatus Omnitrophica bacterium]|nr:prephenate dehydrogenase [Candidatus Omnitrophota bacterium]